MFLIDYAAAQPCTVECPAGSPGCPTRPSVQSAGRGTPYQHRLHEKSTVVLGRQESGWSQAHGKRQPGLRRRDRPHCLATIGPEARLTVNIARPITLAKITDGTSHTFLLGEKYLRSDLYDGGSKSDDKGWTDGWDPDAMRSTCFQPYQDSDWTGYQFPPLNNPADLFGKDRDVYYFGSAHTGGFNGIFADGSIRTLSYDIDVVLFNALATRAGEEVVDESAVN